MDKDKFVGKWVKPVDVSLEAQVGRSHPQDMVLIAKGIVNELKIGKNDAVLEVCCGNGLITKRIAEYCKEIHGVDFSEILIKTAKKKNNGRNIYYYLDDALNIDKLFSANFFDKSYCYFGFQYFDYKRGKQLINALSKVTKHDGLILIGDIPDKRLRWNYYNTFRKKIGFLLNRTLRMISGKGEDSLGWWWHSNQIREICKKLNLRCEILEQDKMLPHAHYRFDALISKCIQHKNSQKRIKE